jgi:UDP-N-acetylmuramate: L-alanyl-gamma-D-glutamyl-meso-diaminopimelate ligase
MKKLHFIAIGGAIMHQLALALQREGYAISGSDDEIADPARSNLAAAGLLPLETGWFPEKITPDLDAVVLGMHAKADNPELLAAKQRGVPVYSFPQYVFEVSRNKQRVVVAGSHGKTTITSMIMHILKTQGRDFDFLVGAKVAGFDQSVRLSDAPLIVIEGDEYPASAEEKQPKIFFYHPHVSILSGIAWDHINVFPTYEIYFEIFTQYLRGMEAGSLVIYNEEDPEVVRAISAAATHLNVQGYRTPAYRYSDGRAVVDTDDGSLSVSVFGRHNFSNMEAAIRACVALGVPVRDAYAAITSFTGAARRLEQVRAEEGLLVYRDFAHAPSKLKATLDAVREAYSSYQLVACFELHTYSSLNLEFLAEYAHSMDAADNAIVFFSHHAIELKGLPPLQTGDVKTAFAREDMLVCDSKSVLHDTVQQIVSAATKPVFLLLMSSGTFEGMDWNQVSLQK